MAKSIVDTCCEWALDHEDASPEQVCADYPKMMRKVLTGRFGMPKSAAEGFINVACEGNWDRLHETRIEQGVDAESYAHAVVWDVMYCSDRWSWDRVLRIQWAYQRLKERVERDG